MPSNLKPPLKPRLQAVAERIRAESHADIGCDHALLPQYLLSSGRVQRIIAIEKHPGPYQRARRALENFPQAELRQGDGLGPLCPGEVDSLSITGMGALNMVRILRAHPGNLPASLILQPMDDPRPIRLWALGSGYHLCHEHWVPPYCILGFQPGCGADPAYHGLPDQAALHFGPHLLRAADSALARRLDNRLAWAEKHHLTCLAAEQAREFLASAREFLASAGPMGLLQNLPPA